MCYGGIKWNIKCIQWGTYSEQISSVQVSVFYICFLLWTITQVNIRNILKTQKCLMCFFPTVYSHLISDHFYSFYHHWLNLPLPEFRIDGVTHCIFFCVWLVLAHQNIHKIHPFRFVYQWFVSSAVEYSIIWVNYY